MGLKVKIGIVILLFLSLMGFAQEETRVVDSLLSIVTNQEGRDKVLTMIELTWEFYDVSYDDCLDWGEKAIKEAQKQSFTDLEANAMYALGMQYGYHGDLDLSKLYLKKSYSMFMAQADTKNAFESLWNIATFELGYGNMDSASLVYSDALGLAEQMNDSVAAMQVMGNQAIIHYQKGELEMAEEYYNRTIQFARRLGMEEVAMQIENNLATLYFEKGKQDQAKEVLLRLIPKLELDKNFYLLVTTYKTLGTVYEGYCVNYDSAMYCFEKALYYADCPVPLTANQVLMRHYKSDVFSDIAHLEFQRQDYAMALKQYEKALSLAEAESYVSGQMRANFGLGMVYAYMGHAIESMDYLNRYFELESKSGITLMRDMTRKPLALDYARLGRFNDLFDIIDEYEDENTALLRENADLYEQNDLLKDELSGLLQQYDSQNTQIQTLQTQRNHYRLAFYGLLSIAIFTLVLLAAYKIVRKKRTKV